MTIMPKSRHPKARRGRPHRFEHANEIKTRKVICRRSGTGFHVRCVERDYDANTARVYWRFVGSVQAEAERVISAASGRKYVRVPAIGVARFLAYEFLRSGQVPRS